MTLRSESSDSTERSGAAAQGEREYYLYGIVPADTPLRKDILGHDDSPVERIDHGSVAAVVGPMPQGRALGRRADLMTHSRVVDALAAQGPVIPARFGTVLPSGAEVVEELLVPNAEYHTDLLEDLSGKAQFNLRAQYDEQAILAEVVAEDAEIAALRERTRRALEDDLYGERVRLGELVSQALEAKRDVDAQTILDLVAPHTVEVVTQEGGGLERLLEASFLVDDAQRQKFESAAEDAASLMAGRARLRLLGPLAPYDFVGGV
ncbi:MAG: GvpL/GvpF family gas vesicle protein [Nocardioidaceae bacterium]